MCCLPLLQEERTAIAALRDTLDTAWKAEREVAQRVEESTARRRFLEMQVRQAGLRPSRLRRVAPEGVLAETGQSGRPAPAHLGTGCVLGGCRCGGGRRGRCAGPAR